MKINISINTHEKYENFNSFGNYLSKNYKLLSNRTDYTSNNQRHSTISSCSVSHGTTHILKNSLKIPSISKIENHINKLTLSNPNL